MARAPALDRDPHQLADAALVERLERVVGEDARPRGSAVRNVPSASSREKPSAVCVRSFVPKEKKSAYSAISSARTQARGSSIIVPHRYVEPALLGDVARRQLAQAARSSSAKATSGCMISTRGACAASARPRCVRGAHDRPDLHLVDLGPLQAEAAAARPEHRVRLVKRLDPLAHALVGRLLERRQELVQRRVEQPDRHRQPGHRLEDPLEVGLLHRQQALERARGAPPRRRP